MKKFWTQFKWYIVSAIGFLISVVLFVLYMNGRKDGFQKGQEWVVKQKEKIIDQVIVESKKKNKITEDQVKEIDEKIKVIREKREDYDKKLETEDLSELEDLFKSIGY